MLGDKRRLWWVGLLLVAVLALGACTAAPPEEAGVSEGDTAQEPSSRRQRPLKSRRRR